MSADRISELTRLRDEASAAYYGGETESQLTDEEFDAVTAELAEYGTEEQVGHGYVPAGKVAHLRPMQSLTKVRTDQELARFLDRTGASVYDVELKYDGLAISLVYLSMGDGTADFQRAVTRGNGVYGEDVTEAVQHMINAGRVPFTVGTEAEALTDVEIRGEIILDVAGFAAVNADGKYSNARNAAAGILRRSNNAAEQSHLRFVVHDAGAATHIEGADRPVDHFQVTLTHPTVAGLLNAIAQIDLLRHTLPFDTDGAVIKVTSAAERDRLGLGSHAPHWAVAYKFASEIATTTLRDVKWQLGRSGKLTPVAVFDAVTLAGASVTQATLHNAKTIRDFGLRLGDQLSVTRSGEVIPYIVAVTPGENRTPVPIPTTWDGRDGVTYPVVADDINLRVDGYLDPVPTIVYALRTLGILGIADSLVTKLVDTGKLAVPADLLGISTDDIVALDRQGVKSAENAVAAIRDGLQGATVGRWFATLGIPGLGRTTGRILEERFGTLDAIAAATPAELDGLEGFGPITTADFLANQHRVATLAATLRDQHGYEPAQAAPVVAVASPISGLNVVITGTVPGLGRTEAQAAAEKLGATVRGSVSKTTDLLIAGDGAGSKIEKAAALGVKVMAADEFVELIG